MWAEPAEESRPTELLSGRLGVVRGRKQACAARPQRPHRHSLECVCKGSFWVGRVTQVGHISLHACMD